MTAPTNHLFSFNYGTQDWIGGMNGLGPGGFFPPPPPGFAWFDVGDFGAFQDPWHPWNMASMAPLPLYGGLPSVNFQNAPGGIANEPGYSYVFPKETCKLHVINSQNPPWQNDGGYHLSCYNVPCNITLKELLQQFGCNNSNAGLNRVHEMAQGGDGRWYKGLTFVGDNKSAMGKTLQDVGWDETRNGVDKDYVWVWFTKG
jgi:hypothetical protein